MFVIVKHGIHLHNTFRIILRAHTNHNHTKENKLKLAGKELQKLFLSKGFVNRCHSTDI